MDIFLLLLVVFGFLVILYGVFVILPEVRKEQREQLEELRKAVSSPKKEDSQIDLTTKYVRFYFGPVDLNVFASLVGSKINDHIEVGKNSFVYNFNSTQYSIVPLIVTYSQGNTTTYVGVPLASGTSSVPYVPVFVPQDVCKFGTDGLSCSLEVMQKITQFMEVITAGKGFYNIRAGELCYDVFNFSTKQTNIIPNSSNYQAFVRPYSPNDLKEIEDILLAFPSFVLIRHKKDLRLIEDLVRRKMISTPKGFIVYISETFYDVEPLIRRIRTLAPDSKVVRITNVLKSTPATNTGDEDHTNETKRPIRR